MFFACEGWYVISWPRLKTHGTTPKPSSIPWEGNGMKTGIDSYCFHRYFGEVYDNQQEPGKRITCEDFLNRAIELEVAGVSLETCFFESQEEDYLKDASVLISYSSKYHVLSFVFYTDSAGSPLCSFSCVDKRTSHLI